MFLHIRWPDWTACGISIASLIGTLAGYIPAILASIASVVSIAWIVQQWIWKRRDRKDR